MKYDKYMGLDVHQAMTVAVVIDAEGKVVLETMVATEAAAVLRLVKSLSGPLRVTFEESTQAEWLYELLRSHVTQVVVCYPRRNKLLSEGSKADKVDARKLADLLRTGMLRSVYHGHQATHALFAAGAERRDDLVVAEAGRKGAERDRQVRRIDAQARQGASWT